MGRDTRLNHRLETLTFLGCMALLVVSGCPGSNSTTNWPTERLDNHPTTQPVAVKVADMDGDGLKDVISLWRGASGGNPPGAVAIHFQNADGTWSTTTVQSSSDYSSARELSVADMNLDSHPDILVAAHDRLRYLRAGANPRSGSDWTPFDIKSSTGTGTGFNSWFDVTAAQIDGANGLDIVASLNDNGRLVWFASPANPDSADGWTLSSIDSSTRKGADSLVLIDLNGDGRLDVVSSATGDSSGEISWYEQPDPPTTEPWTKHIMTSWGGATRLAMGDLDGDGLPDLVAISPTARRVAWFPHPTEVTGVWNGWVLADYTRVDTDDRAPVDVAIADIDANGRMDVVVVDANPSSLFWYTPTDDNRLRWTEYRIAAFSNITYGLFAVDDLDADNLPEVIVPTSQPADTSQDRIDRYINPVVAPQG